MKLNESIDQLLLGKNLTYNEASPLFETSLLTKQIDSSLAKLVLILLSLKGENAEEISGLVSAIRKCEKTIKTHSSYLVDGCGTGGDGSHTFNISTIASIVAAGAGARVAKHGNRGISSKCGSADLLEAFHVNIEAPRNRMLRALNDRTCGIGYFHAPMYHTSFKSIQPIRIGLRKRFGLKTIFNVIGPLTNPLCPKNQVIGVYRKDLIQKIAEASKQLGFKHVLILHSDDGMDELTTTAQTNVAELKNNKIRYYTIDAKIYGFKKSISKNLKGGNAKRNQQIGLSILKGMDRSAKRDVVILNAAAILYVAGIVKNLKEGIKLANESIDSGKALIALTNLIRMSHGS